MQATTDNGGAVWSPSIPPRPPPASDLSRQSLSLSSAVPCADHTSLNLGPDSKESEPQPGAKKKCLSKELFTCFALSSIVIGLPVAIIIVLINLPRLSTRRDTRQQHYILLAFGFPFTLVVFVSILYAIYRLVIRIRTGPNHAKHLRSRMSWRRFSRRFRILRDSSGRNHHRRHRHSSAQQGQTIVSVDGRKCASHLDESDLEDGCSDECTSCEGSQNEMNTEPKLYSLVTEVMQVSKHHQQQHLPRSSGQLHQVFPEPFDCSQSLVHLSADGCYDAVPPHLVPNQRRYSDKPPPLG